MPSITGTGLCVLPDGLLTVRTSLSGSWISMMLLPPPSRLMDCVQPCACMICASSYSETPSLKPGWRPSTTISRSHAPVFIESHGSPRMQYVIGGFRDDARIRQERGEPIGNGLCHNVGGCGRSDMRFLQRIEPEGSTAAFKRTDDLAAGHYHSMNVNGAAFKPVLAGGFIAGQSGKCVGVDGCQGMEFFKQVYGWRQLALCRPGTVGIVSGKRKRLQPGGIQCSLQIIYFKRPRNGPGFCPTDQRARLFRKKIQDILAESGAAKQKQAEDATIKAGPFSAGKHHCENSTIHGSSPVGMFATMPQTLADCQQPALELHQIS